jgi:hypothetical protein
MTMNNISTAARNALCDTLVDLIDVGGAGTIKFYTSAFGTLLGTLTFSATAFGSASVGVATAAAITQDVSADANGTAVVCRIANGSGTTIWEGTVGTSGADFNFNTNVFTAGDAISVTSYTVTMPAA